jgi:hypothetical protein
MRRMKGTALAFALAFGMSGFADAAYFSTGHGTSCVNWTGYSVPAYSADGVFNSSTSLTDIVVCPITFADNAGGGLNPANVRIFVDDNSSASAFPCSTFKKLGSGTLTVGTTKQTCDVGGGVGGACTYPDSSKVAFTGAATLLFQGSSGDLGWTISNPEAAAEGIRCDLPPGTTNGVKVYYLSN